MRVIGKSCATECSSSVRMEYYLASILLTVTMTKFAPVKYQTLDFSGFVDAPGAFRWLARGMYCFFHEWILSQQLDLGDSAMLAH